MVRAVNEIIEMWRRLASCSASVRLLSPWLFCRPDDAGGGLPWLLLAEELLREGT